MDTDDRDLAGLITKRDNASAAALLTLPTALAELDELRRRRVREGFVLERSGIDRFGDSRSRLLQRLRIAVLAEQGVIEGTLAARVLGALAPPVFADPRGGLEAPILLTAASLEGIALAALQAVLAEPGTSREPDLRALARLSISNHERQRTALEALLRAAGGRLQDGLRPAYISPVPPAARGVRRTSDVVIQVALLERLAAEVYRSDMASIGSGSCRLILAAIAAVDSGHAAGIDAIGVRRETDLVGRRALPGAHSAVTRALGSARLLHAV